VKEGTVPPTAESVSTSPKLYDEGVAGAIAVPCPSANEVALGKIRHNRAAKQTCIVRRKRFTIAPSPHSQVFGSYNVYTSILFPAHHPFCHLLPLEVVWISKLESKLLSSFEREALFGSVAKLVEK
jgi:hypothetical protein